MITFNTINDLKLSAPLTTEQADVFGYYAIGDGGGGKFYYDTNSVLDDNGGTVIKPASVSGPGRWIGIFDSGFINFKRLGAKADSVTDCHAILQDFLDNQSPGTGINILFPAGSYFFSDTIVVNDRVVYFLGEIGTAFQFPQSKTGLIVTRTLGYQYSVFEKLTFIAAGKDATDGKDAAGNKSTDNGDYKYRGCEVFAVSTFRDCSIINFSGHGLVVYGAVNDHSSGPAGYDASLSRFENIKVASNGGNGVWAVGPDANQIHFTQVDARDNGRFGIWDQSFLGNMWYTCHCNNNAEGPYWCQLPTTQSTFENCYSEMYDPSFNVDGSYARPSRFDGSPAIIIGGLHGAGLIGGTVLSSGSLTPINFGNLQIGDGGINFPLPGYDANHMWRLGTPDGLGYNGSGDHTTNAITLRPGLFESDTMNFLRPESTYYGRIASQYLVAFKKIFLGGKLRMPVNSLTEVSSISGIQIMKGDRFYNNDYDGSNPEGWMCKSPGVYKTVSGSITAHNNGPTLVLSDASQFNTNDSIVWDNVVYTLTSRDGLSGFYVSPVPQTAGTFAVTFAIPKYKAFGTGAGTTAQRPSTLTADDAGWQYFDTTLNTLLTWSGSSFI